MNSSKKQDEQTKLSRSKSEVKKQDKPSHLKANTPSKIKRTNTERKEIATKKYRQYQKTRHKKSKSPNTTRASNQKIQIWGLEFYPIGDDGVQDVQVKDKIYEILSGETHMFFLNKNKQVYGMGSNEYGQLGLPNISLIQRPQLLPFSQKISVNRLFVGPDFSYCITTKHQVYSWGLNLKGQLGLGHFENVPFPALVSSLSPRKKVDSDKKISKKLKSKKLKCLLKEGEFVIDISCGALHTLALTNKSLVYSCGFGENYSLGHNSSTTLTEFKEISFFHQLSSSSSHKIEKICSGTSHSGALVAGKVYLWGTFAHSKYCLNKIPNAVHLNQPIVDFVLGDLLTVLLTKSGEVFTLGENTDGQLGIEEVNNYNLVPVSIPCKIQYICCGLNHVIAINNDDGESTPITLTRRLHLRVGVQPVQADPPQLDPRNLLGPGRAPLDVQRPRLHYHLRALQLGAGFGQKSQGARTRRGRSRLGDDDPVEAADRVDQEEGAAHQRGEREAEERDFDAARHHRVAHGLVQRVADAGEGRRARLGQ